MIVVSLGAILPAATCLFAWLKGGGAERNGAILYAISVFGTIGFQAISGQSTPVTAELFLDTSVAVCFLVLAICYNNLWLGAAMMVKGLQLGIHATRLTDGEDPIVGGVDLYAAGLNLIALVICMILAGGTIATMRQRARLRRQPPPAPMPAPIPPRLRAHAPAALGNG